MSLDKLFLEFSNSSSWLWIINIFIIIFFTLLARYIQVRIFDKLASKATKTDKIWDDAFIFAIDKPLGYFIWLMGFTFAALLVKEQIHNQAIFAWIGPVRTVGIILLLSWSLLRFFTKAEHKLVNPPKGKKPVNKTTALAIGRLLRIAVIITTVLVTLQALDIPVTGVLALGSAGTLILGIASKDLLANFFGGLMIFLDGQLAVGDWIRSPDKEIEGIVEHIGWRLTVIRTFDKRPLYVPNATFLTISIENASRMSNRRIREVVSLRYKDATKIHSIVEKIENMLREHKDIDTNQILFVAVHKFGASSLDCLVYCFTKTTEWVPFMKIQQDVFFKITEIVEQHGVEIALPARTIDIPEDALFTKATPETTGLVSSLKENKDKVLS